MNEIPIARAIEIRVGMSPRIGFGCARSARNDANHTYARPCGPIQDLQHVAKIRCNTNKTQSFLGLREDSKKEFEFYITAQAGLNQTFASTKKPSVEGFFMCGSVLAELLAPWP